ncbi:hypothetical protein Tco_1432920 [Tanacetum coccineum]
MYYKILSDPLTALKLLKTDEDLCLFVKDCYENSFKIDLFTDHSGYGIIEMIAEEIHPKKPVSHVDSDSDVETNHPLDYIVMSLSNLNMKIRTENPNPNLQGKFLLEVEDPDDEQVESKFKAKNNVSYPSFNTDTPLNECKPVLEMRFKSPQQLKHMLVNYGKKSKIVDNEECESSRRDSKKGDGRKALNEIIRKVIHENDIREKYLIDVSLGQCQRAKQCALFDHEGGLVEHYNVSLGQCQRAKQCALFDHEGGLVEHYSKLWRYTQAILYTNPGSTCELEIEVNDEDGKFYFRDDLNLGDRGGISMISYRHKGLIQAVADCLRGFFWVAAATSMEVVFLQKIEEIKMLDEKAHEWLVERNPNSRCMAYFEMDRCSAAFENEISESFNLRILQARGKPIIIMLKGIMVYLMQRMWCMNKLAFDNKDSITPSVRRQMEYNKKIQMYRISL